MGCEEIIMTLLEKIANPERHARIAQGGLFLKEQSIDYIAREYCALLKINILRPEQIRSVTPEFQAPLCYLEDPEFCWTGKYIPIIESQLQKAKLYIPESSGKIFSCAYYLSPRDPYLQQSPRIQLLTGDNIAIIRTVKKEYVISRVVFNVFATKLQRSFRSRRMFSSTFNTRRECIQALESLLICSKRASRTRMSIPEEIKKDQRTYRTSHGWYFAFKDDVLVDVSIF